METDVLYVAPTGKNDTAQGHGSSNTYARRYGLQPALGIPAEDDDGNAASSSPRSQGSGDDMADWIGPRALRGPADCVACGGKLARGEQGEIKKVQGKWIARHPGGGCSEPVPEGNDLPDFEGDK